MLFFRFLCFLRWYFSITILWICHKYICSDACSNSFLITCLYPPLICFLRKLGIIASLYIYIYRSLSFSNWIVLLRILLLIFSQSRSTVLIGHVFTFIRIGTFFPHHWNRFQFTGSNSAEKIVQVFFKDINIWVNSISTSIFPMKMVQFWWKRQ